MINQKFNATLGIILLTYFLSFSTISSSQMVIKNRDNFGSFSTLLFDQMNHNLLKDKTFRNYPYNLLFEHAVIFLPTKNDRRLHTVKGKIGNEIGYFIIDSGAHNVVFNSNYQTSNHSKKESYSNSLTGKLEIYSGKVKYFELGNISITNFHAHIADLTNLETQFEEKILGLIGYQFLKDYEVVFNLSKDIISLHQTDKKGNWINKNFQHPKVIDSLDFKLRQGFPVIEIEINGKKRKMLIDSGAEFCFIKHKKDLNIKKASAIYGVNGNPINMKIGRIKKIKLTDKFSTPNMISVLISSKRLSDLYPHKIDGVIGQNVFKHWIIGINYEKKKIYFYDFQFPYK